MKILTTHVGSLPRPHDLLDLMKEKLAGRQGEKYDQRVRSAVAESVKKQVAAGIDIVTDGEQGKPGFFLYVNERLEGFTPRPGMKRKFFPAEVQAFPEYTSNTSSRRCWGARSRRWCRWCAPGR